MSSDQKQQEQGGPEAGQAQPKRGFWKRLFHPRQWNWFKVSIGANIVIALAVVGLLAGQEVIRQSDTNPRLCNTCHIMRDHVASYLTGTNLDAAHAKAGVQCKECHDYPVPAEIRSGINYLTGNYTVTKEGSLVKKTFGQEMCTQCHIGMEHVANKTDHLARNPHLNHWPDLVCSDCHVSHGEQIDRCSECHDNGGQRMVGDPIVPRRENRWANPDAERPDVGSAEISSTGATGN